MTKQTSEMLLYEGETVDMRTTPLHDYFTLAGIAPHFLALYSKADLLEQFTRDSGMRQLL
jgi:hypothetical protein